MKEITEFLLSVYSGREWQLPQDGGLADLEWLDGSAPNDLEQQYADYVPAVAPVSVSRFQALAALLQANLLDAVTAWANDPGRIHCTSWLSRPLRSSAARVRRLQLARLRWGGANSSWMLCSTLQCKSKPDEGPRNQPASAGFCP